jgi:hypothetical protein
MFSDDFLHFRAGLVGSVDGFVFINQKGVFHLISFPVSAGPSALPRRLDARALLISTGGYIFSAAGNRNNKSALYPGPPGPPNPIPCR